MAATTFTSILQKHQRTFHPVVPFDPGNDKLYRFDFTEDNKELDPEQIADTEVFAAYINRVLMESGSTYGIGGYGEHRTLYARSQHFDRDPQASAFVDSAAQSDTARSWEKRRPEPAPHQGPEVQQEPRRFHLGIDIWGPAGTKVMAPLNGVVHSFAFNNNDSDYGATLILTHNLEGAGFHTLYGHLSLNSLKNLHEGKNIGQGDVAGEFGMRFENGNWPPHLHFQLIQDMQGWKGDYPGVCKFSERARWMDNCPDPDLVLQMNRYIF